MRETWFACVLVLGATGCPDIQTDTGEGSDLPVIDGPTVEFDPANSILPFPNNLATADGKVSLPAQPCESPAATAIREGILNSLDGFGTFESALQITFTDPVDPATLDGNILIYQRTANGTDVDPSTAKPLDVIAIPGTTFRFSATNCAAPAVIDALTIVPKVPMEQHSTYIAVLKSGIKTATGTPFLPSTTWGLVRNGNDPVTFDGDTVTSNETPLNPADPVQLAQLMGLDLLWKAHAQGLAFIDKVGGTARGDMLVGFEFTTQTVTDPLDPTVAGSPAAILTAPFNGGTQTILPNGVTAPQFLASVLPAGSCDANSGPLPCSAVGDILSGFVVSPNYQTLGPNPLAGGKMIPGTWTDAVHPMKIADENIQALIAIPKATAPPTGYPTLVFGHGLTRSKEDVFAIVSQLAALGVATVAIDFVASGSRAVQISTDATLGCAGTPDPKKFPQCYAQILSTDLAGTRDNLRQTALDLEATVAALKACGTTTSCGSLTVDTSKMMYAGQSLGGIIGSLVASSSTSFKSALLNVPGVGLIDILEHTDSLAIRCSLVDGLIDAGVVMGAKFNPADGTGECTTEDWKTQPGYIQFSGIARWILDPADGANYFRKLDTRRFLIQEVVNDQVVPNFATDTLGGLTVMTPGTADCNGTGTPAPSAAISTDPLTNKWVRYPTTDATACPPVGDTYQHGSWLSPSSDPNTPPTAAQLFGTARMQTDAFTYLFTNVEAP